MPLLDVVDINVILVLSQLKARAPEIVVPEIGVREIDIPEMGVPEKRHNERKSTF